MNPEKTISIHPYFKVREGHLETFKALLPLFVERTSREESCYFYDFTINGDLVFCREAYEGAAGALFHLDNVGDLLQEALKLADLIRLEIHGAAGELEKLKEPLAALNPEWFVFERGLVKKS